MAAGRTLLECHSRCVRRRQRSSVRRSQAADRFLRALSESPIFDAPLLPPVIRCRAQARHRDRRRLSGCRDEKRDAGHHSDEADDRNGRCGADRGVRVSVSSCWCSRERAAAARGPRAAGRSAWRAESPAGARQTRARGHGRRRFSMRSRRERRRAIASVMLDGSRCRAEESRRLAVSQTCSLRPEHPAMARSARWRGRFHRRLADAGHADFRCPVRADGTIFSRPARAAGDVRSPVSRARAERHHG